MSDGYEELMPDVVAAAAEDCEYDGHIWEPAGGGLLICMRCEAEDWEHETPGPQGSER